jgi:hypothetical protein
MAWDFIVKMRPLVPRALARLAPRGGRVFEAAGSSR